MENRERSNKFEFDDFEGNKNNYTSNVLWDQMRQKMPLDLTSREDENSNVIGMV